MREEEKTNCLAALQEVRVDDAPGKSMKTDGSDRGRLGRGRFDFP